MGCMDFPGNRIDFVGRLVAGGDGNKRDQVRSGEGVEGQRVLGEITGTGGGHLADNIETLCRENSMESMMSS